MPPIDSLNMSDFRPEYMYPGFYSPGQVAFNGNPELSQLISMLGPAVLSNFAGEGAFIPHMGNTMAMYDQYRAKEFQNERFGALYDVAPDNNDDVTNRLLGMTKIMSDTAADDPLVQEQMAYVAEMANNPVAKMLMGQFMGADNVEAMLHGSRGDVHALTNSVSQMAYTMTDPSGAGKMSKDSIASYSRGLMSHLYDPEINVDRAVEEARSDDVQTRQAAVQRLQRASQSSKEIVQDTELIDRMVAADPSKINEVYSKYISGGTETDVRKQAEAIARSTDATRASGVLTNREQSVEQAARQAREAPVNDMRGFMAGQMGQMAQYLQEKGQLPSSIGSRPLEERLQAISNESLDEFTEERLGRELAREDLADVRNQSDTARRFRSLTSEKERQDFIEDVADPYTQKIKETKQEIDKFAAGDENAKTAEEISEMAGLKKLTTNVDASKSADVLSSYTDSLAAIREIFGDNGNPNAPMSQLIAALEGLAGSAQMELNGKQISSELMSIQAFAKNTGTSMREVFQMKNDAMAQASSLGLTEADALRATKGALAYKEAAKERGIFETRGRGRMTSQEAAAFEQSLTIQGQASNVNKGLAAMVAVYESDPERFAGTELEAAAEAYKAGSATYEYGGKTKNLAAAAAKAGDQETQRLVATGFSEEDYEEGMSAYYSAKSTGASQEYSNDAFIRQLQNAGYEQIAADAMAYTFADTLKDAGTYERLGFDRDKQARVNRGIGERMAEVMLEAENMPEEERVAYVQKSAEERIYQELVSQGVPEREARREANAAAEKFTRTRAATALNATRGTLEEQTGNELTKIAQVRSDEVIDATNKNIEEQVAQNEQKKQVSAGKEKTILQRGSDYFDRIAREGTNFSLNDAAREVLTQEISEQEILDRVDPDASRAVDRLTEQRRAGVVDQTDVDNAVQAAVAGDEQALRELAGNPQTGGFFGLGSSDTPIVSAEKEQELINARTANLSDDELQEAYAKYGVNDGLTTREEILADVATNPEFARQMRNEALSGEGVTSVAQLADMAQKNLGNKTDEYDEKLDKQRKQLLNALTYSPVTQESAAEIATAVNDTQALGLGSDKVQELEKLLTTGTAEEDVESFITDNVAEEKRKEVGELVRGLVNQRESGGLAAIQPIAPETGQEDYKQIVRDEEVPDITGKPPVDLAPTADDKKEVATLNDSAAARDAGEPRMSVATAESAAEAQKPESGESTVTELEKQTGLLQQLLNAIKGDDKSPATRTRDAVAATNASRAGIMTGDDAAALLAEAGGSDVDATTDPEFAEQSSDAQPDQEPEKRYTAEEWAKLHAGETEEDAFGEQVTKTPLSPGLPDGNYTRRGGGEYIDNETGKVYDRYGNPAGGTYSEDGSSWSAGDSVVYADGAISIAGNETATEEDAVGEAGFAGLGVTAEDAAQEVAAAERRAPPGQEPEKRYTAEESAKLHAADRGFAVAGFIPRSDDERSAEERGFAMAGLIPRSDDDRSAEERGFAMAGFIPRSDDERSAEERGFALAGFNLGPDEIKRAEEQGIALAGTASPRSYTPSERKELTLADSIFGGGTVEQSLSAADGPRSYTTSGILRGDGATQRNIPEFSAGLLGTEKRIPDVRATTPEEKYKAMTAFAQKSEDKKISMSGTLTLDGLQQAILRATGTGNVIDTDGAPIVLEG